MRINRSTSLFLSAAVALAIAAPATAGSGNSPHNSPGSQSDSVTHDCNDQGDTISLDGPTLLWPPNHKLVPITITMTDGGGGEVMFATTTRHNEIVDGEELAGSGDNTKEDYENIDAASGTGSASADHQIRAERSGQGDGRTYTITVDGSAGGDECSTTFSVVVPHDMRPSNREKPNNEQDA